MHVHFKRFPYILVSPSTFPSFTGAEWHDIHLDVDQSLIMHRLGSYFRLSGSKDFNEDLSQAMCDTC